MKRKLTTAFLILAGLLAGCSTSQRSIFMHVESGHFADTGNNPYYFIGANLWYGSFLAAESPSCDRERLCRELDRLKALGINNLRIAVGADGREDDAVKVKPILQTAPGIYNDAALDGLDFLMAEIGKREMYAVLYLTNAWTWSGGYGQYLEWSGRGECKVQGIASWDEYKEYAAEFHKAGIEDECKQMLDRHIRFIVSRTTVTDDKGETVSLRQGETLLIPASVKTLHIELVMESCQMAKILACYV